MKEVYEVNNLYFGKIMYASYWVESHDVIVTIYPKYHILQKNNKKYTDLFNGTNCYPDDPKYLFLICLFGGNCVGDLISFKEAFPEYKESTITTGELESKLAIMNTNEISNSRVIRI